ncbi:AAA family ATPase [Pseudoclavibacter sp. CFCC 14310]|uniref:AAA family ATPase n=1 Tax=Pseudoclavibacter sp. CFCC 14310 TaxID=2615180 RepID=UPI0013011852|nr:AAA family ATPase [Pseudoclavibacter sp. CFCC 14310]KAB1647134.1 AAA family ATPase [Pseudoclavibacter sp. CFCC 14310]
MTTAFDRLMTAFETAGLKVKHTGPRSASAQAPGHSAKDLSVSIKGIDGQVLVHSFSDPTADVLAAVGVQPADLFDEPRGVKYEYRTESGALARTVYRSPGKVFRQDIVDKSVTPLYHLDEVTAGVRAGKRIWVCEGEKDADVLRSLGEVATTSPQGAQSWEKADYTPLAHALQVTIAADDDEPGRKRAEGLYQRLQEICSGSVNVVLPAEGCKDIADHIMAGHGPNDLRTVSTHRPARRVALTKASDVTTTHQSFVAADLWPEDVLSLVAGRAGEGKSTWVLHKLAQATRGELEGDYQGQRLTVAITATEDAKPLQRLRLEAAGADLDRVLFLDALLDVAGEDVEGVPRIPEDLPQIRRELDRASVKVWVIDPLTGLIAGDSNRRDDVRASLDPLAAIARDLHIAIVGVAHFGKGGGRASDKVSGSHAFRDTVRSLILIATDDETGDRVLTLDKSNYSTAAGKSWAFRLENTEVATSDGTIEDIAHVEEIGETEMSVSEIINREPAGDDDGEDRNAAQAFILDYLKNIDGLEAKAGDVLKAGRAAGFSDNELKHARKRSKDPRIASRKSGFGAGWVWGIDEDGAQGATKVPKVPAFENVASSAPSVAPSPRTDNIARLATAQRHAHLQVVDEHTALCPVHNIPLVDNACAQCLAQVRGEHGA